MTQQDDITQRNLTDDEIVDKLQRVINMLVPISEGKTQTAADGHFAKTRERAATINDARQVLSYAIPMLRAVHAALASAPVAAEHLDGLRTLLAQLPGMREDPRKGDAVFRCGVNGALDVVEGRIRELLRSAPVAGEAQEHYDEVKFTLQGAHRIMESLSAIERRVGPVGSHARGYTHKITNALRHLDALYAAPPASTEASTLLPELDERASYPASAVRRLVDSAVVTDRQQRAGDERLRSALIAALEWIEGERSPASNPCAAIRAALSVTQTNTRNEQGERDA